MNRIKANKRVRDLVYKNLGDKSVRQFSEECGIPASTIRKWLYCEGRVPYSSSLKKLSEVFNVSVDYLRGVTDDKNDR